MFSFRNKKIIFELTSIPPLMALWQSCGLGAGPRSAVDSALKEPEAQVWYLVWSHTLVDMDHEIFSTVIFHWLTLKAPIRLQQTFINTFSFFFSEKIRLMFFERFLFGALKVNYQKADRGLGRGFTWNLKPYFLRKIKINVCSNFCFAL